ncbi:P1 family peptidase [Leucobacter luti]|uniref:L-aminopeptidase/D-esterase-like protein n=1 Tax=Leucobacter luti TaxID=340320 RepID=A0A4Q7U7B5_9MICO|nr:P1 family peptidase [Leucobacter luti]MBL3701038.1 S58 family peptidase [Leucobacter luti]RZT68740.1 L-aminopeptidase/D-esterase-like protein [Leucobacter luti]
MFNVERAAPPAPERARDLGVEFDGEPGALNAITDVPGLEVGLVTLIGDEPVATRTGVTAILPRGKANAGAPCAAGVAVLNGNGELTGRSWIEESGQLQTPIAITNSHAVGAVHRGVDAWMATNHPASAAAWMLPVVGETWDGYLNSINADTVRPEHAARALDGATGGPVAEGNVGGGTGMNCYGFKGGTGTASRVVRSGTASWTVGVLLQANFGSRAELRVQGRPLGRDSAAPNRMEAENWFAADLRAAGVDDSPASGDAATGSPEADARTGRATPGAGSVIVIVATDAPLLPDQCRALARRVSLGLARTGTTGSHFSGDIFLAFSTANEAGLSSRMSDGEIRTETLEHIAWGSIDPFYAAVVEATEEAVVNALVGARDMTGRDGHTSYALPHEEVRAAFGA